MFRIFPAIISRLLTAADPVNRRLRSTLPPLPHITRRQVRRRPGIHRGARIQPSARCAPRAHDEFEECTPLAQTRPFTSGCRRIPSWRPDTPGDNPSIWTDDSFSRPPDRCQRIRDALKEHIRTRVAPRGQFTDRICPSRAPLEHTSALADLSSPHPNACGGNYPTRERGAAARRRG